MSFEAQDAETHETEAQRLLAGIDEFREAVGPLTADAETNLPELIAQAQVHATLALSLRQADHTKALRAITHRGAILTHQRGN